MHSTVRAWNFMVSRSDYPSLVSHNGYAFLMTTDKPQTRVFDLMEWNLTIARQSERVLTLHINICMKLVWIQHMLTIDLQTSELIWSDSSTIVRHVGDYVISLVSLAKNNVGLFSSRTSSTFPVSWWSILTTIYAGNYRLSSHIEDINGYIWRNTQSHTFLLCKQRLLELQAN